MEFPEPPARFIRSAEDGDAVLFLMVTQLYAEEPQIFRAIILLFYTHFKQSATTALLWLWAMAVCTQRQRLIFTAANDALWQLKVQHPRRRNAFHHKRPWSRVLWTKPEEFWLRYSQQMLKRLHTIYRHYQPPPLPFQDSCPCVQCGAFTANLCTFCPRFVCIKCATANTRLVQYSERCAEWNHFTQDLY